VAARPATLAYRAGKLVSRHRVATLATALATLLVLGLVAFYTLRLQSERDRVQVERAKAEQVADFLVGLFRMPDESGVPGRDLTASALLARGVERLEDLKAQPLIHAELLETIGDVYLFLDMLDEGEPLLREALTLRERHRAGPLDIASSHHGLGRLAYLRGDYGESLRLHGLALDIRRTTAGEDSMEVADSLYAIGAAHQYLDHNPEAREAFERALDVARRRGLDEESSRYGEMLGSLAGAYRAEGRMDEAERIFRELLERTRRLRGDRHLDTAEAAQSLATLIRRTGGRAEEAEPLYRLAIDIHRQALGRHTTTAQSLNNYAVFLRTNGRAAEARPLHYEALDMYREVLGPLHPDVALATINAATWERDHGDRGLALEMYDEAATILDRTVGRTHWMYWAARHGRARTLQAEGRHDEAIAAWTEAVRGYASTMGADHTRTKDAAKGLADWLRELGRPQDADALLAELGPS
jgi:serine/threonine-protein kinase